MGILYFRRLYYHREIRVTFSEFAGEFYARLRIFHSFVLERNVAYNPENVLAVFVVKRHSLLVVAGKHHFRTSAHTEHLFMLVERLGRKLARLLEQEFVDQRKHRRIESH